MKKNSQLVSKISIIVFIAFIAICVLWVLLGIYDPSQNNLRAFGSVCMDVVCMIILFILICSFALGDYVINKTTRLFRGLLLATIWAMFLDFLNWAFDGLLEFGHLTFWFTAGSLCMGAILACLFSLYLYSYMEENHRLSRMRLSARICAVLNVISFCLAFILAITGTAFTFVDGHYEIGALYDIVMVAPVLTILFLACFVIRYVKKVGIHDTAAAVGYVLFMIAGALIEEKYGIGTTYVAVAIADIFIFVMLQNEVIAREKRMVQVWMKKSTTDELTNFANRLAYEEDIAKIENNVIEDDLVYVSIDVNSLKSTNDSLGHNAGDEMLRGAAECLKMCFGPYGKLYRIGGDEFIALINVDEEKLNKIKNEIVDLTERWNGKLVHTLAISCGYVTRNEARDKSIRQMAVLADQRMYEAKNEYYRKTGIDRRKK